VERQDHGHRLAGLLRRPRSAIAISTPSRTPRIRRGEGRASFSGSPSPHATSWNRAKAVRDRFTVDVLPNVQVVTAGGAEGEVLVEARCFFAVLPDPGPGERIVAPGRPVAVSVVEADRAIRAAHKVAHPESHGRGKMRFAPGIRDAETAGMARFTTVLRVPMPLASCMHNSPFRRHSRLGQD